MSEVAQGPTKEELKAQKQAEKAAAKEAKAAEKAAAKEAAKAQKNAEKTPRVTMAHAWGEVFHQAATEGKDQAWVEETMIARFPNKEATVRKWTQWYKNFYNTGNIKGFESPVKVTWVDAKREAKKQAAEAKKAEKAAAREEARQQKAMEREQKKAEAKVAAEAAKSQEQQ